MKRALLMALLLTLIALPARGDGLLCRADDQLGELALDIPGPGVRTLVVDGDIAYLAARGAGLLLVDISDPSHPQLLGQLESAWSALTVSVRGSTAYVGTLRDGMFVVDVSDPASPTIVGQFAAVERVYSIVLRGDVAYLGCGSAGLRVVDVLDPANPEQLNAIITPGTLVSLSIDGDRLLATSYGGTLRLFDISLVTNPTLIETSLEIGDYIDAQVANGVVYALRRPNALEIYDISDDSFELLSDTQVSSGQGLLYDLDVEGDRVVLSDTLEGVSVFDVSDRTTPTQVFTYPLGFASSDEHDGVSLRDGIAYIGGNSPALVIIDVRRTQTTRVEQVDGFSEQPMLATHGGMLYAADDTQVSVYEPRSDGTLELLSRFDEPFNGSVISSIAVDQDHLYVSGAPQRDLAVYDLSTPASPTLLGQDRAGNAIGDFMLAQDGLVIRGSGRGIDVLDASDAGHLVLRSHIDLDDDLSGMRFENSVLYTTLFLSGMRVYNLSDPASPDLEFSYNPPLNNYLALAVHNGIVYCADQQARLDVFDCRIPSGSLFVKSVSIPTSTTTAAIAGSYLYLGGSFERQSLMDVSDPLDPSLAVIEGGYSFAQGAQIIGDYAYVSEALVYSQSDNRYFIQANQVFGCAVCAPDLTGDGVLDFFDVSAFIVAYLAQDQGADWNDDGLWDFFDVSGFLVDYQGGCP